MTEEQDALGARSGNGSVQLSEADHELLNIAWRAIWLSSLKESVHQRHPEHTFTYELF
jgi:hypothetical protein